MKDDEARYLIDQYNKYAAWNAGYWSTSLPYLALFLATVALVFSILFQTEPSAFRTYPVDLIMILSAFGLLILVMVALLGSELKHIKEHLAFCDRLVMLEDHRSRYKSLPDALTFEKIISLKKLKTKDLETLLKESEPSSTVPQT
jgi:hypothetical protein